MVHRIHTINLYGLVLLFMGQWSVDYLVMFSNGAHIIRIVPLRDRVLSILG